MLIKKDKAKKINFDDENFNKQLFEKIQPQGGITFKEPNYLIEGDGYIKCIHIYRLPSALNDFWLNSIMQIDGTVSTISMSTRNKLEVQKNLNRALQEEFARQKYAKDFEELYDAQKRQAVLQNMYDEIQSMGEVVKMTTLRIYVYAKTLLDVEEKCGKIMDNLETSELMPTVLLNEGKVEWQALFESYTKQQEKQFAMKGFSLTTEQIAGGYPFNFSSLEDPKGSLLGFTDIGGIVTFDEFRKTKKRKFYNSVAVGDLGSGKSTLLKKRFRARAEQGDFVRTFDVSGEFTKLTKEFGGKIIKCDGRHGILNPLEILRSGDDEATNYARHISKVTTFYKCLVPDVKDDEITSLQNVLREFYEYKNLVPREGRQITSLPANKYPTFSSLLDFLKIRIEELLSKAKNSEVSERKLIDREIEEKEKILKSITNLVKNFGNMFDGYTSINNISNEKIVTFDISTIKDLGNVFVAQLFNMLYFCWDSAVANGLLMKNLYENEEIATEDIIKSLIIVDESHRWVNTNYPYILDMLTVIMREARKYFAGIFLASQSFRDFVPQGTSTSNMNKLRVVFELTQYKFIMRQDSSVLPLIGETFGSILSPWQMEKIPYLEQGQTILSISGDRNIYFKIWLSMMYEDKLFAGGL